MKEKSGQVFGSVLFVIIIFGMVYLIANDYTSDNKKVYSGIDLYGNELLPANDYLINSKLYNKDDYSELTLPVVKARIEKHPYVEMAEVQSDADGKILINVFEKKMKALILSSAETRLITENFQLIKLEKNTNISTLPVISNVRLKEKQFSGNIVASEELERAFKIIDAISYANESMFKNLAEVNMRYGKEILLTFSGVKSPLILGKGNEVEKVVKLSALWEKIIKKDNLFADANYIDLRFRNEIFIGKPVTRN